MSWRHELLLRFLLQRRYDAGVQHSHISGFAANTLKGSVADKNSSRPDRHPASIGEQIKEVVMAIDGDYTIDINGKLVIEDNHYHADRRFCFQCDDYEKVIAVTANYNGGKHDSGSGIFNSLASHQGDLDCSPCHSIHSTFVMDCTSCHNADVSPGSQTILGLMQNYMTVPSSTMMTVDGMLTGAGISPTGDLPRGRGIPEGARLEDSLGSVTVLDSTTRAGR